MSADPTSKPIVVVLGPTAGGKSALAVGLCHRLPGGGEVVGADSMQVYRLLDAGTAKPGPGMRAAVPHHLIDCVEPTERFTVADWLERADAVIAAIHARGRVPVVVGGTNLYIKALLEGLFAGPGQDAGLRAELAGCDGTDLHARLALADPEAAARIHPNDHKKLVRALEVYHLTGRPISAWQTQWRQAPAPDAWRYRAALVGLAWPSEAVNRRINRRVKTMFAPEPLADGGVPESLPAEVQRLEAAGLLGPQAREALGYKQVLEHLVGRVTLDEAMEKTKILTRRLAKTQRTWLKRFAGVGWLAAAELGPEALVSAAWGHVSGCGVID